MKFYKSKYIHQVLFVITVSFLVRFLYFNEIKNSLLKLPPVLDAKIYHDWACRIVNTGDLLGKGPFFQNPGYSYLLALIYKIFGVNIQLAALIQLAVGTFSAVLVYFIAAKIFDSKVGVTAGILSAMYGPFIFCEGLCLTFVWINFFNLLSILFLIKAKETESAWLIFVSAVFLGISALFRSNILLFIPLLLLWFWIYARKYFIRWCIVLGCGILLVLSPVILRNYIVLGEPILSNVSSGINFYIGNNPNADGSDGAVFKMSSVAGAPEYMLDYFKNRAEEKSGKKLSYIQVDRFWFGEALNYIISSPGQALRICAKKIFLFVDPYELPNNYGYIVFEHFSQILKYCLDMRIILVLTALGLFFYFFEKNKSVNKGNFMLILLLFLAQILTVVITFMLSEYRLPSVFILIIISAYGLTTLVSKIVEKAFYPTLAISLVLIVAAQSHLTGDTRLSGISAYWIGATYKELGDTNNAKKYLIKSINLDPLFIPAYDQMGLVESSSGKYKEAEYWLEKAIDLSVKSNEIHDELYNTLANIYLKESNFPMARKYYIEALKYAPQKPEIWTGLGNAEWLLGHKASTVEAWAKALELTTDPIERGYLINNLRAINGKNSTVTRFQ
jgi:4-amino-4-deoxy-L-arabinose transferase-like glycosyltransferase/Flp pilus assembly protein TadD